MAPAFDQLCVDTSLVWKTIRPRGLPVRRHTKGLALDRERVLPRAGAGHSKLTRIARARNMACQVTKLWSALSTTPPARGGHTRAAPNRGHPYKDGGRQVPLLARLEKHLLGMVRMASEDGIQHAELSANIGPDGRHSHSSRRSTSASNRVRGEESMEAILRAEIQVVPPVSNHGGPCLRFLTDKDERSARRFTCRRGHARIAQGLNAITSACYGDCSGIF